MKIQSTLLLLVPFLILISFDGIDGATTNTRKALLGGWKSIKDVKEPHVQEIAKFAVSQHNKEANTLLAFSHVVKGETQVVAGTNYRLVIAAKDGDASKDYQAVVWEKLQGSKDLTSFKPLN